MRAEPLGTTAVLNDASALVKSIAAPWLGLLWATGLPVRLLQVNFILVVAELGAQAGGYGRYLMEQAALVTAAFVLAVWGRAVWVRASGLALDSGRKPGTEAWRLRPAALNYLYVSLLIEVMIVAFAITLVALPVLILAGGLAAGTLDRNTRPSLVQPLKLIAGHGRELGILVALLCVHGLALLVAFVNLLAAFQLGLWLAGSVPGLELAGWQGLLGWSNPQFLLLVGAGALLAVEPFWLAACVTYTRRLRARSSGEDLRRWFALIRMRAVS